MIGYLAMKQLTNGFHLMPIRDHFGSFSHLIPLSSPRIAISIALVAIAIYRIYAGSMVSSRLEVNCQAYNAAISACEKKGNWQAG